MKWLERVQMHLKAANNIGIKVNVRDDNKIKPGAKWKNEIKTALAETKVAILLITTEFLASDFIRDEEIPAFLKAAEGEGAVILPLLIKPCLYKEHPTISEFQAVNDPAKPLSTLPEHEQDEALVKLAKRVMELVR